MNFYNVYYAYTHVVGTSGGNTYDMKEASDIISKGLDIAGLVTHIGGLNVVIDATLELPNMPGCKRMIYNYVKMLLIAIAGFKELGKNNAVYCMFADVGANNNGLWSVEADELLLANAGVLQY